jgi:hypothetical protein
LGQENTFLKPVYTKYLNTIVHDMYINVLVLYSPILLLILMDMNCTNTLLWSNFQCLRLMIHVFTDHKQVQELHLKNQLNRGYNKLPKKKKKF